MNSDDQAKLIAHLTQLLEPPVLTHCEEEYEPAWRPVPGNPSYLYDANQGEYEDGMSIRTFIPVVDWRALFNAP
jgi:hypothetical protein